MKDGDYTIRKWEEGIAVAGTIAYNIGIKEQARLRCLDNAPMAIAVFPTLRIPPHAETYSKN